MGEIFHEAYSSGLAIVYYEMLWVPTIRVLCASSSCSVTKVKSTIRFPAGILSQFRRDWLCGRKNEHLA